MRSVAAPFWKHLPGERKLLGITVASIKVRTSEYGGDDANVKPIKPKLFKLGASKGSVSKIASMPAGGKKPSVSVLKSTGPSLVLEPKQP